MDKDYNTLCELEIAQSGTNPGVKKPYQEVCQSIRDLACRFTNQVAVVKTHFKKPAATKARAKGKAKAASAVKPAKDEDLDGESMET